MVKRNGSVKGATHYSSKVTQRFKNGGEVGGVAGGSGVDGSGNRGNGGFGGGSSASQGGGGMGGGGKGGVGGTGVSSGNKTGTTMSNQQPSAPKGGARPTSAPSVAYRPNAPVAMAPPARPTIQNPFNQASLNKVANFRQAMTNRYGWGAGNPNIKPGPYGAPLNGDYHTSRYSKGGKVKKGE